MLRLKRIRRLILLSLALLLASCAQRAFRPPYVKNPEDGMIYWSYQREIVPYKYKGGRWVQITPENIRNELGCVGKSQEFITKYLKAKGREQALGFPAVLLIVGGITGILINPLVEGGNTVLFISSGALAAGIGFAIWAGSESGKARVSLVDAVNSYNAFFLKECKGGARK